MDKRKRYDALYWGVWAAGIVLYFLLGRVIPMESRHLVWCSWDDLVPFVPAFVIPYVLWYALLIFTSVYCFLKEREVFRSFIGYVFVAYAGAAVVFLLYPTYIDFRPAITGQDLFSRLVGLIYALDTPTNVLPSLHVLLAVGIAFALCRTKLFSKPLWKVLWWLIALSICASTVLIKQHSVLDILGAIPLCAIGYVLFFGKTAKSLTLA